MSLLRISLSLEQYVVSGHLLNQLKDTTTWLSKSHILPSNNVLLHVKCPFSCCSLTLLISVINTLDDFDLIIVKHMLAYLTLAPISLQLPVMGGGHINKCLL